MSRVFKPVIQPDNSVEVKVSIGPTLWEVLKRVGTAIGSTIGGLPNNVDPGLAGFRILLARLDEQARLGSLKNLPGTEWQAALEDRFEDDSKLPADFDRTWLHLSSKRKSGYVGVYSYGACFKARARHPSSHGEIELGSSFKTAELAALARFYWYLKHEELAYGTAEEELEYMRSTLDKTTVKLTDAQLWPEVLVHLQLTGRVEEAIGPGKPYLLPGPRAPQLEARRAAKTPDLPIDPSLIPTADPDPAEEQPKAFAQPFTWGGLLTEGQQEAMEPPAKRRPGRPRIHFQDGDFCGCGVAWPCRKAKPNASKAAAI